MELPLRESLLHCMVSEVPFIYLFLIKKNLREGARADSPLSAEPNMGLKPRTLGPEPKADA